MGDPGQLYAVIIGVLLLVALGVSVPVLVGIARDGLERHRKRRAGKLERDTDDEEFDRRPPGAFEADTADRTRVTCRRCGTENDAEFTYCRRCTTPL
ncbi:zinc ribbon domain-containing protein [Natrinema thermotolerans]|uniref:Zinc ribbon domain-containing protein n=1 Tax=Natrinema thermotolerans TaxID=121872 RepID=A0AAF0T2X3_9EURY|nr:zinc ribbon domain-containing protein [Natrinema thermotolerans]ELZ11201.1 hypothetical protein C478_12350 [Natrinema thermotolerans DSM 11552]QCC58429.1 zinc ribbon domain-containing protein [Natrinema thermotolerans]WMT09558.1 zinc ribbon domain-containing protein [Natrinema thermotolerans]